MLVVSDTSPITNLAAIGRLVMLHALFDQITIPKEVRDELTLGGTGDNPGATEVRSEPWFVVVQAPVRAVDRQCTMTAFGAGEVYPGISVDPAIAHGKPVITGTRVPVAVVLHQIAGGQSIESVCASYELTAEQVRAAVALLMSRQ